MGKIDLVKQLKHLYQPSAKEVVEVEVPEMNFLMVDGEGDPNTSQAFKEAIQALFPLSYTLKFMVKKGPLATDYGVMPLEGLWWTDDMANFSVEDKSKWKWTVMIMQPDFITAGMVAAALAEVKKKKNPAALDRVYFRSFSEGTCAQTLHVGPFSAEGPTVVKVHHFIEERGCRRSGKHHEIYLSDISKAAPEKWKTVVRQPMSRTR